MANLETSAVIRVVDRASPVLRKINRALDRLGLSFGKAGRQASNVGRAGRALERVGRSGRVAARGAQSASRALVVVGNRSLTVSRRMGLVRSAASKAAMALRRFGSTAVSAVPRLTSLLKRTALGLTVATGGLFAAAYALGKAAFEPAKQMEGFMVQLKALYGGDMAKARKAMDWIIEFAKKTPLELPQVIRGFLNLKAMGIDPMNGSFKALVDTMSALGVGFEGLQGIILSLGQAWSMGKLQGDTFREMATRGVDAAGLLGKALGKTAQQVRELGSKGKLTRKHVALLIALLGKKFAGASEEYAKTWEGMTSNMSDAWWNFRRAIGEAGFFDTLKAKLQGLLDVINKLDSEGTLDRWAQQLGNVLTKLVQRLVPDAQSIEDALRRINFEKIFSDDVINRVIEAVESLKGLVPSMKSMAESAATIADAFKTAAEWAKSFTGGARKSAAMTRKAGLKETLRWKLNVRKTEPDLFDTLSDATGPGPARYMKGSLMPGFMLPEQASETARKVGETASGIIIAKSPSVGQRISEAMQARATTIGNMIGQAAAAQIRAAVAGARIRVDAFGARAVGPRAPAPAAAPVGMDAPATPASE